MSEGLMGNSGLKYLYFRFGKCYDVRTGGGEMGDIEPKHTRWGQ